MDVRFTIPDDVLLGAGLGAAGIMAPIIAISALAAAGSGLMSLGGYTGFKHNVVRGVLILGPIGAVIGGAVAATTAPLALSAIIPPAALIGFDMINGSIEKRRRKRRGY